MEKGEPDVEEGVFSDSLVPPPKNEVVVVRAKNTERDGAGDEGAGEGEKGGGIRTLRLGFWRVVVACGFGAEFLLVATEARLARRVLLIMRGAFSMSIGASFVVAEF